MTATLTSRPPRLLALPDGREFEVGVRASGVARTMWIRLGVDQPLEILVPESASDEDIDAALRAKAHWIADKLTVTERARSRPAALGLSRSGLVWLDGAPMPVRGAQGRRSVASIRNGELIVAGPEPAVAIRRWYQREARVRARLLVAEDSSRLDVYPAAVAVRDQRTRWGSCSPRGAISINWRLALAPQHVQRYVVIHELCHLAIPNHRKPFWRMLDSAMPDWRAADAWLRQHGDELRRYRVDRSAA